MTFDYDLEDLERLESRSDLLSFDWNLSNRPNDDALQHEENIPWSTNYDDLKDGTSNRTPEFDPKEPHIRDSLTLGQLKQLVTQIPPQPQRKLHQFTYTDTNSLQVEIDEWFSHGETHLILEARDCFLQKFQETSWCNAAENVKTSLTCQLLSQSSHPDREVRSNAWGGIAYIAMGTFSECRGTKSHLSNVVGNCAFLKRSGVLEPAFDTLRRSLRSLKNPSDTDDTILSADNKSTELYFSLTVIYLLLETQRKDSDFKVELASLEPPVISYFIQRLADLRDRQADTKLAKWLSLVLWKLILCLFGGIDELKAVKLYVRRLCKLPISDDHTILTTKGDYDQFRDEIVTKYPSHQSSGFVRKSPESASGRPSEMNSLRSVMAEMQIHEQELMVPSHIATPAPSPPPSPKIRKGVHQTDQSFPFLLPSIESKEYPVSVLEAETVYRSNTTTSVATLQYDQLESQYLESDKDGEFGDEKHTLHQIDVLAEEDSDSTEAVILSRIAQTFDYILPHLESLVVVLSKTIWLAKDDAFRKFENHSSSVPVNASGRKNCTKISPRDGDIVCKAISAILLLLLKWFRLLHVMNYEYMAQIMVDCNVLHLLTNALSLFDDAMYVDTQLEAESTLRPFPFIKDPEISSNRESEDIVFPEESVPANSWRIIFQGVNFLRILQKMVKGKPHRYLLLVQYKIWNILQPVLQSPSTSMAYFALKLVKGLIPYFGRKWRQVNMRIITSIYLQCRPRLRDDWLMTSDSGTDVCDALAEEQNLRSLIQFYLKKYING